MLFDGDAWYKEVIQIHKDETLAACDFTDESLESFKSVTQSKRHVSVLEEFEKCYNGCHLDVPKLGRDLMIGLNNIDL